MISRQKKQKPGEDHRKQKGRYLTLMWTRWGEVVLRRGVRPQQTEGRERWDGQQVLPPEVGKRVTVLVGRGVMTEYGKGFGLETL